MGGLRGSFAVRKLLLYSDRAFSVEAENLARAKADFGFGIVNLRSINLDASLFDQARDFAVRFVQVKRLSINIRNQGNSSKPLSIKW